MSTNGQTKGDNGTMIEAGFKFARDFGIFALICVAFIWWGQEEKRELRKEIAAAQDFMRDKLMITLERHNKVTEAAVFALNALTRTAQMNSEELQAVKERTRAISESIQHERSAAEAPE